MLRLVATPDGSACVECRGRERDVAELSFERRNALGREAVGGAASQDGTTGVEHEDGRTRAVRDAAHGRGDQAEDARLAA
jgi:hypothetical protein